MVKDSTTEERIVEAARRVFIQKGLSGARMQEIADEAGINKALLHYYFRNKEKLFDHIFEGVVKKIAEGLTLSFGKEMDIYGRLGTVVDVYCDILLENRYLPLFVLNAMNNDPLKFAGVLSENMVPVYGNILEDFRQSAEKGVIRDYDPVHLFLNMLGLIIFPFAMYPMIEKVAPEHIRPFLKNFLESRKEEIKKFLFNALTPLK